MKDQKPKTDPKSYPDTKQSTELYHADQAQGADYYRPQNPLKENPAHAQGDIDAKSVPGSKPARNQTRKPE